MHDSLQSVLILGRQPALGLAELESLYGAATVSQVSPTVAGLDLPASEIDFARLGGSTRLARVLAIIPNNLWKDTEKQLIKAVSDIAADIPAGSKLTFGLSVYDIPVTPAKLGATGLTVKKVVRARSGLSVRLVQNSELELSTPQVIHNKLTGPHGAEILIIGLPNGQTLLAQTTVIQDIESYTLRDRGRPKRDARVGMLPPKLAQIIINLANPSPGSYVVDPFCGTGVILQEALLMGFSVYGTDLEQRMVDYSQANLDWLLAGNDWLRKNIEEHKSRSIVLEKQDATTFVSHISSGIETIACETYLGRPFTSQPEPAMLQATIGDCNLIISKFLRSLWEQIPYGAQVCIAVPAWQTAPGRFRHLPLVDELTGLGYNRVSFEHVRDEQLLYYREDQYVARELLVLTRR